MMTNTELVEFLTRWAQAHADIAMRVGATRALGKADPKVGEDANLLMEAYQRLGLSVVLIAMEAVILRDLIPGEDKARVEGFLDMAIDGLRARVAGEEPKGPH